VTPELTNEHKVFARAGSFWSSVVGPRTQQQARRIVESTERNAVLSGIDRAAVRLTDNAGIRGQHLDLNIQADSVTRIPTVVGDQLQCDTWRMPIQVDIVPLAFETKLGKRVIGNDYTFADGIVAFRESAYSLFDFPHVHVLSYQETLFNTQNYALWLETPVQNLQEVSMYYRDRQTADQFQRAIAVAAGYSVLPFDGVLNAIVGTTYIFDKGIIDAPYQHTPLTVGPTYPAGTVIGDVVRVHASNGVDTSWYQKLDWNSGMPLDSLCPFAGLSVQNANVAVTLGAQSSVHLGKYHVSAPLIGDPSVATKFWAHQATTEDRSNRFMNDAIGLTLGNPATSMNLLDFYFQYLLGARGIIIDLPVMPDSAEYHARAARFIAREAPVGSIPIIRHT